MCCNNNKTNTIPNSIAENIKKKMLVIIYLDYHKLDQQKGQLHKELFIKVPLLIISEVLY